jgi:AP-5 complex subunit zeta-1
VDGDLVEAGDGSVKFKTRLMTVLISAIGKLGARCQDLIPRVILCLTKIMKRQHTASPQRLHHRQILERASQVASTLQRPSVAATVLAYPYKPHHKVGMRHRDPTSTLALLHFADSIALHTDGAKPVTTAIGTQSS